MVANLSSYYEKGAKYETPLDQQPEIEGSWASSLFVKLKGLYQKPLD